MNLRTRHAKKFHKHLAGVKTLTFLKSVTTLYVWTLPFMGGNKTFLSRPAQTEFTTKKRFATTQRGQDLPTEGGY